MLTKIALCGTSFYIYLKSHFGLDGDDKMPLIFSTAYALSGFVAAYSWNIMWMDSVMLAPLIILGLEKLVKASYHLLGLMSFLTSGEDETRAWTIKIGTKAPQAAGKIHSDFERGFIKAEVVNYQDLLDCGSYAGAREKGLVRMEGKDYVVQDGDVILFRFNV